MHPRLVQDDVRELGQAVFDVLHPAATDDIRALSDVRLPERGLVDPIGFFQHPLAEPNASNISIVRQAMPSAWPSISGPDFARRSGSVGRLCLPLGGLRQSRIAGLEPVEMELHGLSRFPRRNRSPSGRLRIAVCCQTAFAVSRRDQGATCNQLSPQDDGGNLSVCGSAC